MELVDRMDVHDGVHSLYFRVMAVVACWVDNATFVPLPASALLTCLSNSVQYLNHPSWSCDFANKMSTTCGSHPTSLVSSPAS